MDNFLWQLYISFIDKSSAYLINLRDLIILLKNLVENSIKKLDLYHVLNTKK